MNVRTKEMIFWESEGVIPSLPVFMATPGATEEDDGIIITNCTGVNGVESFFVVLDAKTMVELARATIPVHCGFGIHANFFHTA